MPPEATHRKNNALVQGMCCEAQLIFESKGAAWAIGLFRNPAEQASFCQNFYEDRRQMRPSNHPLVPVS